MISFVQILGIVCIVYVLAFFYKIKKTSQQESASKPIDRKDPLFFIGILYLLWFVVSFVAKIAMILGIGVFTASMLAIAFSGFFSAGYLGIFLSYLFGRIDFGERDKWGTPVTNKNKSSMFSLANILILWAFADYYSFFIAAGYNLPELAKNFLLNII